MSGIHDGVAANILRKQKKAYFVHCNVHSLDLALQDLTKQSTANVGYLTGGFEYFHGRFV